MSVQVPSGIATGIATECTNSEDKLLIGGLSGGRWGFGRRIISPGQLFEEFALGYLFDLAFRLPLIDLDT